MSDIENKLTEMRNGFAAVSAAVEAISKRPAPKPEILDRQLSGNKINGGLITNFASTMPFGDMKYVLLDEADYITPNGQAALRGVMEMYHTSCRFILTCNYLERIIDPLQSRCKVLKITPPSKKEVAQHVANVLDQEDISYENFNIAFIVNKHYPDVRKILNTCQVNNVEGTLKIDKTVLTGGYKDALLKELKSLSKTSFKNIRQILADSNLDDFEEIYRFLYDSLD